MKVIDGDVIIKGFVVIIGDIKAVDVKKPATFEFQCSAGGIPSGALGRGKASFHLWMGSAAFIEHFGKTQTRTINRLCKLKAKKMLNELLEEYG